MSSNLNTRPAPLSNHLVAVTSNFDARRHLYLAMFLFVVEIATTLNVESLFVHIMLATTLFGREIAEIVNEAVEDLVSDV